MYESMKIFYVEQKTAWIKATKTTTSKTKYANYSKGNVNRVDLKYTTSSTSKTTTNRMYYHTHIHNSRQTHTWWHTKTSLHTATHYIHMNIHIYLCMYVVCSNCKAPIILLINIISHSQITKTHWGWMNWIE